MVTSPGSGAAGSGAAGSGAAGSGAGSRARSRAASATGEASGSYPGPAGRPHPGPAVVTLPSSMRGQLVGHVRAELPNEACGLIAGDRPAADGGRALRWEPARNALHSPLRYELDPRDLFRLSISIDDAGEVIWGIVHSHVASPARPSQTDLRAAMYPDALYLLVSLDALEAAADPAGDGAGVRAWRILDGGVHEVAIRWDGPA